MTTVAVLHLAFSFAVSEIDPPGADEHDETSSSSASSSSTDRVPTFQRHASKIACLVATNAIWLAVSPRYCNYDFARPRVLRLLQRSPTFCLTQELSLEGPSPFKAGAALGVEPFALDEPFIDALLSSLVCPRKLQLMCPVVSPYFVRDVIARFPTLNSVEIVWPRPIATERSVQSGAVPGSRPAAEELSARLYMDMISLRGLPRLPHLRVSAQEELRLLLDGAEGEGLDAENIATLMCTPPEKWSDDTPSGPDAITLLCECIDEESASSPSSVTTAQRWYAALLAIAAIVRFAPVSVQQAEQIFSRLDWLIDLSGSAASAEFAVRAAAAVCLGSMFEMCEHQVSDVVAVAMQHACCSTLLVGLLRETATSKKRVFAALKDGVWTWEVRRYAARAIIQMALDFIDAFVGDFLDLDDDDVPVSNLEFAQQLVDAGLFEALRDFLHICYSDEAARVIASHESRVVQSNLRMTFFGSALKLCKLFADSFAGPMHAAGLIDTCSDVALNMMTGPLERVWARGVIESEFGNVALAVFGFIPVRTGLRPPAHEDGDTRDDRERAAASDEARKVGEARWVQLLSEFVQRDSLLLLLPFLLWARQRIAVQDHASPQFDPETFDVISESDFDGTDGDGVDLLFGLSEQDVLDRGVEETARLSIDAYCDLRDGIVDALRFLGHAYVFVGGDDAPLQPRRRIDLLLLEEEEKEAVAFAAAEPAAQPLAWATDSDDDAPEEWDCASGGIDRVARDFVSVVRAAAVIRRGGEKYHHLTLAAAAARDPPHPSGHDFAVVRRALVDFAGGALGEIGSILGDIARFFVDGDVAPDDHVRSIVCAARGMSQWKHFADSRSTAAVPKQRLPSRKFKRTRKMPK